jgi:hypothetical protein
MSENDLTVLLGMWYASHCDGDWEHGAGIHIATIDNPGWSVVIDLVGTLMTSAQFEPVDVELGGGHWYSCRVEDSKFRGWGGAHNLSDIVRIFLRWVADSTV